MYKVIKFLPIILLKMVFKRRLFAVSPLLLQYNKHYTRENYFRNRFKLIHFMRRM